MIPAALIFLVYDGVLQTSALPDFIDFEFLPRLEDVLRACPFARVAISPAYRYGIPLAILRKIYSRDIQSRVIGVTPDLANGRAEGGRYAEIQAYLQENGFNNAPWVALDDEAYLFPKDCPQLILTNR